MELAEPIDYSTTTYKAGVDYAHTNTFVSMSYSKSDFSNNIDSLTWDNPFQATNGAATLNSAGTSLSSAPARGQMALSPDNEAHNWALTGAVTKLPWNSTLSASFTRGKMTQNDSMLPMTVNSNILNSSLLSPAQRAALNSTPTSANLAVDTSLDTVTWSARPVDRLSLKARYRRYHYDNKSTSYEFPYSVVTDGSTSTVASDLATEPRSYETKLGSLDANYELGHGTNLLVGYKSEKIDRVNGQVPESTEKGPSVAIERTVGGWLSLKSSYEHLNRTGAQDPNEFLDGLLYFNQAPRKTTRRRFEAIASVNDRLTLSANAGLTKFNYPDSAYGRLNYNTNDYELQADYELHNGANTYAYYSHETFQIDQRNYTVPRTTGGVSGNWSAVNDDMVQTVGLGINGKSEKYRLTYGANLAQSWTKGSLGFLSEVSTNLNPVPWTSVDASSLKQINLGVRYNIQHNLDWSTGVTWERFRMNDFDNNAPNVPTNASGAYNGAILMGTLPSYYNVRTLYTSVSLKF